MPLKQDDKSPYPISKVQMLHDSDQLAELRRRSFHIKLKGLLESVQEYLRSD
jgi:hypothetical protein